MKIILLALNIVLASGVPFRLASVFQNGMVLQRDAPIPVWGWAAPGVTVYGAMYRPYDNSSVTINVTSTADAAGLFTLTFPPQPGNMSSSEEAERILSVSTSPISPNCLQFQHYCRGAYFSISAVIGDVILCTG